MFALHGLFPFLLATYAGRVADRFNNRLLVYCGITGYAAGSAGLLGPEERAAIPLAIETITLQHEGWERDYAVQEPAEESFTEP